MRTSDHMIVSIGFLLIAGLAVVFKAMPETKIFSPNEKVAFVLCNKLHDNTCVDRSLNCRPSLEDYQNEFCVGSYYKIYSNENYEVISFTCSCRNSICENPK
jgi:hypothetical protein